MKNVGSYEGKINQDFISVDVANIKVFDYIQLIDKSVISDSEKELLNRLTVSIVLAEAQESCTFSDVRYCYLFINMMLKNGSRIKITTIVDFIVYYQYLIAYYDKNVSGIDSMIRFVNLYIGYTFHSENVTKEDIKELSDVATDLLNAINDGQAIVEYTPQFIFEAISMADGITEAEWKEEASKEDVVIEPNPVVDVDVIEKEDVEIVEDTDEIKEYKDTIQTLTDLIPLEEDESVISEWREVIQTLRELIEEITGVPYDVEKMQSGGMTQKYKSPMLLQFEDGGKMGFKGLAKKVAASYKGKKVSPKYQKEYGKRYSSEEAKEVGNKIAAKVYRLQKQK